MRNTITSIAGKAWIVLLAALLLLIYIGLDRKRRPVEAPSGSNAGVETSAAGAADPASGRRSPIVDRHESASAPQPVIPPSPVAPPVTPAPTASVQPQAPEAKPEAKPEAASVPQPPPPPQAPPALSAPTNPIPTIPAPAATKPPQPPVAVPAKPTIQAKLEQRRHVVRFGPNQKTPSPAEEKKLKAFLQPHEGKTEGLRIIGRADGSGGKSQNTELAKTRAESVAKVVERAAPHLLVKDAPPAEVLGVVDPKRPAAQDRATSRRVEVEILIPAPESSSKTSTPPARNVPKKKTLSGKRGAVAPDAIKGCAPDLPALALPDAAASPSVQG